jgi:hypothetical protein
MEVKFPDGSLVHQDPRLEDTLFYYYPKGDPRLAVAMRMEFDPRAAHPAWTYRFWKDYLTRLRSMSDPDLTLMMQRYAQTIHEEGHGNMKAFAMELPDWLIARVGEGVIVRAFEDAGWRLQSKGMNTFRWERAPPAARHNTG